MDNTTSNAINSLRTDINQRFDGLEAKIEKHDVKKDFYYHIKEHKNNRKIIGTVCTAVIGAIGWIASKVPTETYKRFMGIF